MGQRTLLDLFTESERLLAQYQTLYRLAVRLCGPLDLKQLMEEVTNGLVESFDVTLAYMSVFHDDETYTYPDTNDSKKSIYGSKSPNFKEIVQCDDGSIIVPIRESENEPLLAILRLVDENGRLELDRTKKKLSTFSRVVAPATRRALIEEERQRVSKLAEEAEAFSGLIGESEPMRKVKEQILQAAKTEITALIQGETGTGKERVAEAIHKNSKRKDKPFVAFNCGTLPETLIESELFGHVKGAFTGATRDRKGLFEQAKGGTIFLDEVGEMPPAQQVKLLRVLQEREIRPLGSEATQKVDVRVIAATNKDLFHHVEIGTFRRDLYYRLNIFKIELPPLRERGKDGLLLAKHFLHAQYKANRHLTEKAENALMGYKWHGNVRELENAMERAIAVSTHEITPDHLPIEVTQPQNDASLTPVESLKPSDTAIEPLVRQLVHTIAHAIYQDVRPTTADSTLEVLCANKKFVDAVSSCHLKEARDELEKFLIEKVWNACGQNQHAAAGRLGIGRAQLRNRLDDYKSRGTI